MIYKLAGIVGLLFLFTSGRADFSPVIIPQPQYVVWDSEEIIISAPVRIYNWNEGLYPSAITEVENQFLTDGGFFDNHFPVYLVNRQSASERQVSRLSSRFDIDPPGKEEGYILKVSPDGIVIMGTDEAGLLYGIQTLLQIMRDDDEIRVPQGEIKDYPVFPWRGIHFFTGREALEEQKKLIDFMARHKMNKAVIQVDYMKFDSFPELHYEPFGQCREEVKELIAYARERNITIIPLVSVYSHAGWAFRTGHFLDLAEYPDEPRVFNVVNPATYDFIFTIIDEVVGLFGGNILHIGIDEIEMYGNYPHQPETSKYSLTELMDRYLQRVHAYMQKEHPQIDYLMIWGDTFLDRKEGLEASFAPNLREARARRAILDNLQRFSAPEFIVCDWHYDDVKPEMFTSPKVWNELNISTVASTWYLPGNIQNFAHQGAADGSLGFLQTTWAGFNFRMEEQPVHYEQFSAYLLAADYSWSGRNEQHDQLPYEYRSEFWKRWYGGRNIKDYLDVSLLDNERLQGVIDQSFDASLLPESYPGSRQEVSFIMNAGWENFFSQPVTLHLTDEKENISESFTLRPGEKMCLQESALHLPYNKIDPLSGYYMITLDFEFSEQRRIQIKRQLPVTPVWKASRIIDPIQIDGNLDDWKNIIPLRYSREKFVTRDGVQVPEPFLADLYLAHDEENLYIALSVYDKTHFNDKTGGMLWAGDGVQVMIDFGYDRTAERNSTDIEIGFFLTNDGKIHHYTWRPRQDWNSGIALEAESEIVRIGEKTIYEIRMPLDIIIDWDSNVQDRVGFTFSVNDNDGEGFDGGIVGSRGIYGDKSPQYFGTLFLE